MSADGFALRWRAPGPVAAAFVQDRSDVACIIGPFGSGKTSAAVVKIILETIGLRPCLDGVVRAKAAVVRDTYPNLDATTIATWHNWVPRGLGRFVEDAPRVHEIAFDIGGRRHELEVQFIALGEKRIEDVMRGWEGTWAYVNEADRLTPDVLPYLVGRVGRWPSAVMGGCSRSAVWLDCNAPDTDNWLYEAFVEAPQGRRLFMQPGGRDPGAENVANLPAGYYERLVANNPDWWVRRFVDNRWGASREGKPVYPEYDDLRHCAPSPLLPVRGLPLIIGADAGGTPAATLWQRLPGGVWRGLDELVVANDASMGPTAFGEALNRLLAEERYRGWPLDEIAAWADPASGAAGGVDLPWLQIVSNATKIRFRQAPTNNPHLRQEAVRVPLMRSGEGGRPLLQISPTMKTLRKGFNSHYRFTRIKTGEGRWADEPEKNHWSHVHDAAQYAFLGGGEHLEVRGRAVARDRAPATADSGVADYDPFGG